LGADQLVKDVEGRRCVACGSNRSSLWATACDVEYKTTPDRFAFFQCADCAVLFIHPVPVERLREIYPPNYYSFRPARRTFVDRVKQALDVRRFRRLLRGIEGIRLSALDVGGGIGAQLTNLRAADARIARSTVIDLDEGAEALAVAAGHRFIRGRIEDLRLDHAFDVILMLNLIEHVADPRAVLVTLREHLQPHGRLIVQTPNYESLDARLFRHWDWGGYHCPRHWTLFTAEAFESLARSTGLRVMEMTYTQGAPFWTVSILAALENLGLARITPTSPAWTHPLYPALAAGFAAFDFLRAPFMKTSQMVFVLRRS
jgi:2-polyprenyl-3-methyl-5-hydroxy-6-metoxy-1,4-benzoquinol methylase